MSLTDAQKAKLVKLERLAKFKEMQDAENEGKFIQFSEKGAANGVATLGSNGLVPTSQLPSYVDDVIEIVGMGTSLPATCSKGEKFILVSLEYDTKLVYEATATNTWSPGGSEPETGKLYLNLGDNNKLLRYTGSTGGSHGQMVDVSSDTNDTYKLNINGTWNGGGVTPLGTVYAPTQEGQEGQVAKVGANGPEWKNPDIFVTPFTIEELIDRNSYPSLPTTKLNSFVSGLPSDFASRVCVIPSGINGGVTCTILIGYGTTFQFEFDYNGKRYVVTGDNSSPRQWSIVESTYAVDLTYATDADIEALFPSAQS